MTENSTPDLATALAAVVAAAQTPVSPPPTPTMLTVAETAELLRCSKSLVYRMLGTGELPSVKLGRRRLIPRREVERITGTDVA